VTSSSPRSASARDSDTALRPWTAVAREGRWFTLLVAGIVVLGATPFYVYSGISSSTGCTSFPSGFVCETQWFSNGFFGMGLGSSVPGAFGYASPRATTYWVIGIFLSVCLVVGFFWIRSRKFGAVRPVGPIIAVLLGALVLAVVSREWFSLVPIAFSIRGMQALLIIALGLIANAVVDRSWAFSLYVAGFLGLALLSCLYNVIDLFQHLHLGSNWPVDDQTLPNLILPGIYLVFGGAAFWARRRWTTRTDS
jgi:hypothetical protein